MNMHVESELFIESDSDENSDYDNGVIEEDLTKIDETIKNVSRNMRKGDWTYLCRHPEVRAIIRVIVMEAIKKNPENIYTFAADLFHCTNNKNICKKINKQMKWINRQVKSGTWTPADGLMLFPETSSSSLNSKKTECEEPFNKEDSECDEIFLKHHMCPDNYKPSC
ncbi:uncharacterized protein LOC117784047 [Drosophila innubila]|uniref:uncharacterized protein LOC117784047 n=1 Tax=Drosophila innubila TaxID=198719 RepID=UPI00148DF439|nr:uncharacterized protein LOC117784047 [Drosophila innubila]